MIVIAPKAHTLCEISIHIWNIPWYCIDSCSEQSWTIEKQNQKGNIWISFPEFNV